MLHSLHQGTRYSHLQHNRPQPKGRSTRDGRAHSVLPVQMEKTMIAFAKKLADLYIRGASSHPLPFFWA